MYVLLSKVDVKFQKSIVFLLIYFTYNIKKHKTTKQLTQYIF